MYMCIYAMLIYTDESAHLVFYMYTTLLFLLNGSEY